MRTANVKAKGLTSASQEGGHFEKVSGLREEERADGYNHESSPLDHLN